MRQTRGLDARIGEEAYNPVYGNKKAFVSVFLRLLVNGSKVSFRRVVWLLTGRIIGGCV